MTFFSRPNPLGLAHYHGCLPDKGLDKGAVQTSSVLCSSVPRVSHSDIGISRNVAVFSGQVPLMGWKNLHTLASPDVPHLTSHSFNKHTLTLGCSHSQNTFNGVLQIFSLWVCLSLPTSTPTPMTFSHAILLKFHVILKASHLLSLLPVYEFPSLLTSFQAKANNFTSLGVRQMPLGRGCLQRYNASAISPSFCTRMF